MGEASGVLSGPTNMVVPLNMMKSFSHPLLTTSPTGEKWYLTSALRLLESGKTYTVCLLGEETEGGAELLLFSHVTATGAGALGDSCRNTVGWSQVIMSATGRQRSTPEIQPEGSRRGGRGRFAPERRGLVEDGYRLLRLQLLLRERRRCVNDGRREALRLI